jgi:hypothetical protein
MNLRVHANPERQSRADVRTAFTSPRRRVPGLFADCLGRLGPLPFLSVSLSSLSLSRDVMLRGESQAMPPGFDVDGFAASDGGAPPPAV